jgi:hypothetical protein
MRLRNWRYERICTSLQSYVVYAAPGFMAMNSCLLPQLSRVTRRSPNSNRAQFLLKQGCLNPLWVDALWCRGARAGYRGSILDFSLY